MMPVASCDSRLALALRGIDKRYGTTQALASASLEVRPGTVHALLGENGAGKSTLMRIAYGLEQPDEGAIFLGNTRVRFAGVAKAIAHGIGMVHQHFTLVPAMTVVENIALGGRGLLDLTGVARQIRELSEHTGFALDPDARVESLGIGAQQRVEIAKALVRAARILILDEPTAVLAPAESIELLRWLRAYADAGNSAVLITHKLREAFSIADDVTVLRRGHTVISARRHDVTPETLTVAMIGEDNARPVLAAPAAAPTPDGAQRTVFSTERLVLTDTHGVVRIRGATFDIKAGEIVGIAAVEGNGQRELLRALAGRLAPASGKLIRPSEVGFVPEDRHHDAILLDRSLAENVALHGAGARRGMIDWHAVETQTQQLVDAFTIRTASTRAPMRALSGGNQQRLVLARELGFNSGPDRALVVENPTRGLDVRATVDVHGRLRTVAHDGGAVVLYSSDIDELLLLASRVFVIFEGIVREIPPERDLVGQAMVGTA